MPGYTLHPQVGLRPEQFGALAYHYGNRRLTFLNDERLVAVVRTAAEHADLDTALAVACSPSDCTSSTSERAFRKVSRRLP